VIANPDIALSNISQSNGAARCRQLHFENPVRYQAGAMALTFAPAGFSPIVSPGVLTAITGINVSAGKAVAAAPKISPQEAATEGRHFVAQAPLSLDHSVLNNPDLLPTPNPAPMAVAAYD
jgi:hypothetical protein